jgi:hypothetical protein
VLRANKWTVDERPDEAGRGPARHRVDMFMAVRSDVDVDVDQVASQRCAFVSGAERQ